MADFDIFGPAASGPRLVEFDRLAAQKQLADLAMQPYKMDELRSQTEMQRAHTALYRAQAQEHEQKTAAEEAFLKLMQGAQGQSDQQLSVLDTADQLAQRAAGAGYITKAVELTNKTAQARQHQASEALSLARAREAVLNTQNKRAEIITRLMSDGSGNLAVQTPADWATVNHMYRLETGEQSPYANVPFEMVPQLFRQAMSVKDQTAAESARVGKESLDAYRKSRLEQLDAQQRVREERLRLEREREERLKKQGGGKGVGGPSNGEISQAERLLQQDGMTGDEAKDAAYAVASEARRLRDANKALDADTALRRAYETMKAGGQLETTQSKVFGFKVPFTEKTKLNRSGSTPELATALPGSKSDLKVGRYYIFKDGRRGKWNGTDFDVVPVTQP